MINEKGLITENELMLGDWIYLTEHKTNARVTELRSTDHDVVLVTDKGEVEMRIDMRSIPLTEEILLKNGFKNDESDRLPHRYYLYIGGYNDVCINLYFDPRNSYVEFSIRIRYSSLKINFSKQNMSVHELQHVMRLFGIEKEVVL